MPGEITGLAASQTLDHIIQFVAIIIHIAIDTTLVYTYPQPSLLISSLLSLPLSCLVSYMYYIWSNDVYIVAKDATVYSLSCSL